MNLLPKAVFDQHIIALGKTGAGKSSAIRDIVEHLLDHDHRVIVITPKADWWGLKLAADGKNAGYPIPVFGGQHQDLPLHHLSGKTMAELLGTGNRSAILQMRDFMPGERTQFWIDFASTLFRVLQGKLYLVIDEVHNFAPKGKVLDNKAGMMLHWSNKLASEARGIGITLIGASQRASKVHNDFLTSCETLIAMRVTTKWDRDAVKDWIEGCGDPDKGKEVLNSLAQMKRGDAWAWSPEAEFGPKQIHFPMFKTYDSFRPQTASDAAKLKGWADVDLADVKKKLEHVVKEAEANDPVKLKAQIRDLELRLAGKVVTQVAVSTSQEYRNMEANLKAAEFNLKQFQEYSEHSRSQLEEIRKIVMASKSQPRMSVSIKLPVERRSEVVSRSLHFAPAGRASPMNGDISGPERKVLKALGELVSIGKNQPQKNMVGGWSAYSPTSGGFANILSQLKTKGLIEYPSPGTISLTAQGNALIVTAPLPTREELFRRFESLCSGPERKVLAILLANEDGMSKEDLGAATGYSPTSGGFANLLSALRTKGLAEYPSPGRVRAPSWIFEL
jgi:uncharacterized protein